MDLFHAHYGEIFARFTSHSRLEQLAAQIKTEKSTSPKPSMIKSDQSNGYQCWTRIRLGINENRWMATAILITGFSKGNCRVVPFPYFLIE